MCFTKSASNIFSKDVFITVTFTVESLSWKFSFHIWYLTLPGTLHGSEHE